MHPGPFPTRRRGSARWVPASVVGAVVSVGVLVACGSHERCSFAVSLARTTGGATSAVAAAREFAQDGTYDLPTDGWTAGDGDSTGRTVGSGRARLYAVQGTDGTWFIDSGDCG